MNPQIFHTKLNLDITKTRWTIKISITSFRNRVWVGIYVIQSNRILILHFNNRADHNFHVIARKFFTFIHSFALYRRNQTTGKIHETTPKIQKRHTHQRNSSRKFLRRYTRVVLGTKNALCGGWRGGGWTNKNSVNLYLLLFQQSNLIFTLTS